MNLERAEQISQEIEKKGDISHRILAHTSARYTLFNVNEPEENHPSFLSKLSARADNLAFTYLEIGCSFAENKRFDLAKQTLIKASMLIEYNHIPKQNRNKYSKYYILISAIAYYLSAEFSKAFIVLKKTEQDTDLSLLVSFFLKRDFRNVVNQLNLILLNDNYVKSDSEEKIDDKISTILFAKATANVFEYVFSGNNDYLKKANEIFTDILDISKINSDPGLWWIARLFKLALDTLVDNSLWTTLTSKLNPKDIDTQWEIDDDIIKLFPFLNQYSNKMIIDNYINSLIHRDNPIVELFITQKKSLDKILSENGAVVSLPTSSGKTRIAEIAILQSLINNRAGKILYLAPFRSLAFEIEKTLGETFTPLKYTVSHLYGGSQFSKLDQTLINEAHILIATPEKAKAILRANNEITNQIKLIIIDEGHLIDTSKRNVTNELFIEELKFYINQNKGKIILLSAVLPNTEDISEWITNGKDNIVQNDWRPSSQRLGLLEFTGVNVNIDWYNPNNDIEIQTFNNKFITPFPIDKKGKTFPRNKQEAVASTAVRLTEIGSVLIFVGGTRNVETTVFNYAGSVKTAFQDNLSEINWGELPEWQEFKLVCEETYGENSELLDYAKYGIICHHGKFPNIVRISLDRLLATKKPKIIISTTTLAQGVNIGVSSVIFANVYISGNPLSINDFWNIAGRAGRAFIDTEGKILYAIDKTKPRWNWKNQIEKAKEYFEKHTLNDIESGFLQNLKTILDIANECGISFDTLLQLILENDFTKFVIGENDYADSIKDFFDWTDDVLLTFEILTNTNDWVDTYFRNSLAYIQAQKNDKKLAENIISILKARREALLKIVDEEEKRNEFVVSGLPLMSIKYLDDKFDKVIETADKYLSSNKEIKDLVLLVKNIEEIISSLPSSAFHKKYSEEINLLREGWFAGEKLSLISERVDNAYAIINSYFGYTIPWVLNAIARKFYLMEDVVKGDLFEELSVLAELGLPNFNAAKVYLAGIHSRVASVELAEIIPDELFNNNSKRKIIKYLISNRERIKISCENQETINWLVLINTTTSIKEKHISKISEFVFTDENLSIKSKKMFVRDLNKEFFFTSPDYKEKISIDVSKEFPFDKISNRTDIYFEFENETWKMKSRNPNIKLIE